MQTLCLNRLGNVTTNHKASNQCRYKGQKEYQYHVKILCPANSINKKTKFIVDHVTIHKIIEDLFKKEISSCENMCLFVAKALKRFFKKNNIAFTDIYVRLQPHLKEGEAPVAYMEYFENSNGQIA